MMKSATILLACLAVSAQSWAGGTIARTELGRYTLSLESSGSPYIDKCDLNLVADAHDFMRSISLRRSFYNCALHGGVQILGSLDAEGDSAAVFVEAARGGDGDHTGPIVEVFRLNHRGFQKLGEVELFDATYVRDGGRISLVTGKALFDFCDVCDGPDASRDKLFIPVQVNVLPGGLTIRSTLDQRGKAVAEKRFEDMKRSSVAEVGKYRRTYESYVRKLEARFRDLLAK